MLETTAEYCPPRLVPLNTATTEVLLGASYAGLPCPSAMDCRVRYTLDWDAPTPVSASGECVAPPSPAPTVAPSPPPTGDGKSGTGGDSASGTPPPTSLGENGGSSGEGGSGSGEEGGGAGGGQGSEVPTPLPFRENYLSRSVVECEEEWANCSTLGTNTSYRSAETGCAKLDTIVGEVGGNGRERGEAEREKEGDSCRLFSSPTERGAEGQRE